MLSRDFCANFANNLPTAKTPARRRVGFTLLELLVVISIMLILIGLTIATVNFSLDSERIRAGARQMQSYFEGARDRAIYARAPRGVRFLVDQTNKRTVTSMVFIGPMPPLRSVHGDGYISLDLADGLRIVQREPDGPLWNNLKNRELLVDGARIKIPDEPNGVWYTISTRFLTPTDEKLEIIPPYQGEAFNSSSYRLELTPAPLPNAEPALMPRGIVIDLDGSDVPDAWRPSSGSTASASYSSQMDVLFSPQGTVMGPAASKGLIHFYLAEQVDADRAATELTPRPVNVGDDPVIPAESFGPLTPLEDTGDRLIVTLFTRTGNISSHPVDPANLIPVSPPDQVADDPFRYAETGEVAGQ